VTHSRRNATLVGAVGGAVIALTVFTMFVGRLGLHTPVEIDGGAAVQVTSGSLYLVVLMVAALAGLLIGAIGYGIGVSADPDAPRFGLRSLLPVSSITAAITAYAVLRIGVGGFGDIGGGLVTVGVLRMTLTVLFMGLVAGGTTAGVAVALARPALFGFGGEAWPNNSREVTSAMIRAVSVPLVATIVGAAFAIPLSVLLIELEGDAATIVFSVVGTIVLGLTALVAARPWEKNGGAS
jgi:hypothetical protein